MAGTAGTTRMPLAPATAEDAVYPAAAGDAPLWTSAFALVLGVVHLFFLSNFMMVAALPLYVAKAPRWQIGLVVGVPFVASMILRPFTGRMADRFGRRVFLISGAAGCAITFTLQALSSDVWYLT